MEKYNQLKVINRKLVTCVPHTITNEELMSLKNDIVEKQNEMLNMFKEWKKEFERQLGEQQTMITQVFITNGSVLTERKPEDILRGLEYKAAVHTWIEKNINTIKELSTMGGPGQDLASILDILINY